MQKWYHIFTKSTGLGLYTWIILCILPFYFVFRLSSPIEISIGIVMIVVYFAAHRFAYTRKSWHVYMAISVMMAINIGMTLYFGYVYFSPFLAFFIGNRARKAEFITLYILHVVTTIGAVSAGFFVQMETFISQLPFIIVTVIGIILLPLNMYHTNKNKQLENELQHANERIAKLLVTEERQRIARDLHDTLGQKLSLIGLKSDLSGKLVGIDPNKARKEIADIHQTARTALKELREIVSTMKNIKLKDEIVHVKQMLKAARIELTLEGDPNLTQTPLLVENVLSMCLKEAITNVVKHSEAVACHISINESSEAVVIEVNDNGKGLAGRSDLNGYGLRGMRERLEFVNGTLSVESSEGTKIKIQVPQVIVQEKQEE